MLSGCTQSATCRSSDLVLTAHYSWQSRYLADLQNYNPSQQTASYGMLNLQLGLAGHRPGTNADLAALRQQCHQSAGLRAGICGRPEFRAQRHLRCRRHVWRAAMRPAGAAHGGRDGDLQVLIFAGAQCAGVTLSRVMSKTRVWLGGMSSPAPSRAIAEVGRDHQFPGVAFLHQRQRFDPAGDQLAGGKVAPSGLAWSGRTPCR